MRLRRANVRSAKAAAVATVCAVAGALLVATSPVANAWQEPGASGFQGAAVDLTDIVRVRPDERTGTQLAPALQPGKGNQPVPALQIRLPIKTEATATKPGKQYATWQPGDVLTVSLPSGVTFAKVPTVTSTDLVDTGTAVGQGTGFGAPIIATEQVDGGAAVTVNKPQMRMTLSADKSTAQILITNSQWAGVSADAQQAEWLNLDKAAFTDKDGAVADPAVQPGFVLTVDAIAVNIGSQAVGTVTATVAGEASNGFYGKPEYATYPAKAAVACTVGAAGGTRLTSYLGGTTTLGFLPPLAVTQRQQDGQAINATSDLQTISPMVIGGSFAVGTSYAISADVTSGAAVLGSALFDFPAHTPPIGYMDAQITTSGTVEGVQLAPSAGQYGIARTASLSLTTQTAGAGTVTIAGLRLAGYVPAGSNGAAAIPAGSAIRITVAVPAGAATAVNDASTVGCLTKPGASKFSAVAAPPDTGPTAADGVMRVAETANRIAGLSRWGTAARLALRFAAQPGVTVNAVVVANGENKKGGFDALAANYLAGRVGAPILLTAATQLPDEAALALRALLNGATSPVIYVMGGADSVSDQVVSSMTTIAQQAATGTVTVTRIAGSNRYGTATKAAGVGTVGSVSFAKGSPQYRSALLASGVVSADALAAGPLSFDLGLPVLLTGPAGLPAEVKAYISKQKVQQVFVLGGSDRVSAQALSDLRALGVKVVKRIAGDSRFATSADLYTFARAAATTAAAKGGGLGWSAGTTSYLANGVTGFPDALAVGPLAGSQRAVLLTTGPTALDGAVAAYLKGLPKSVHGAVGLGSSATVSVDVLKAANALVP